MMASVLLLVILFIISLVTWLWSRRDPLSPPGPRGLPLLGSLLSLNAFSPHKSLTEIARKYGTKGVCELHLGSVRTVLLTDPKLVREAFAKDVFSGRAPLYLTHGIMEGQGIICAEGELWKDQRRLLSSWLRSLGATKVSSSRQTLDLRLARAVDGLEKKLSSREDPDQPLDLHPVLADFVGNLVNELVYGVSFRENDETWRWLLHIQEEGVRAMGVAAIVNFMPYLRFVLKSIRKTIQCIVSGQMQTHTILRSIIDTRRRYRNIVSEKGDTTEERLENLMKFGDEQIRCVHYGIINDDSSKSHFFKPSNLIISKDDCVLDYYLDEQEKRQGSDPEGEATKRLSDKQLTFLLADLFGAGLDTTLVSLLWFLLFMATNESEQEAVRNELHSICGNRSPTLDDLPHLPITRAALHEAQRLRPVVPVGIPHGCLKDVMLGGYLIKEGSMVVPLQWAIHTDPEEWEDPERFDPSRFLGAEGEVLTPQHFIPFQTGKRMCPGDELGRSMLFMFGSRLIAKYTLVMEEPIPPLDGVMGLTLSPPPYRVKLVPVQMV